MSFAYYNENDDDAADWLTELIRRGLIPPGEVDRRDIRDVQGEDVEGFTQCHFFAGIGGWPLALRLAGWPDDRPVWSGSCPCQPFSLIGRQRGRGDDRHLWPDWRRIIAERRPSVVFGEQVSGPLGRDWLAGIRSDFNLLGYAVGAADLCAAGVGAPHVRQRLYWAAEAIWRGVVFASECDDGSDDSGGNCPRCASFGVDVDYAECGGPGPTHDGYEYRTGRGGIPYARWLGDSSRARLERHARHGDDGDESGRIEARTSGSAAASGRAGDRAGFWDSFDVLQFRDGKTRRVESGAFPMAYGIPARMGRLRGYGNAIVPPLAAQFVRAYRDIKGEWN